MKIVVLSDTHVSSLENLPEKVIGALSQVDLIIHAGDFTTIEVFNELKQLGEVKAVQGNMDSAELKAILPAKEIIDIENKRIGITHGWGAPWGLERKVKSVFVQDKVDAILYGHSHKPQNKMIDGILFFNPGKASNSFGILTVGEDIKGMIISSKDR
jgi:hypothetical protein